MTKEFENRFLAFIKENALVDYESPVIVGLSGGKDSMTLAHLLHKHNYQIIAAHCNFHLREGDADLDQQLVEDWCEQNSVECIVKHFATEEYAKKEKVSIEMAARTLRYNWFRKLLNSYHASSIAVGHHFNDQIETFFMNIARGTGFRGLVGMKAINNQVVRPLLFASAEEIQAYAQDCKIPFRDDHTNKDVAIKRNFFRHEIIPKFQALNPSFQRTMERNIQRFQSIDRYLNLLFMEMEESLVQVNDDGFLIKIPGDKTKHVLVDFIHFYLEKNGIKSPMQAITDIMDAQVGAKSQIENFSIIRDRNALVFQKFKHYEAAPVFVSEPNTEFTFDKYRFKITAISPSDIKNMPVDNEKVWFAADQIHWPIVIRAWQPGDRMKPLGMQQTKKIKKMLTDAKIPSAQRADFPVMADQKGIIWLPFIRPSQDCAVRDLKATVVQVEVSLT